jgi:hypothetical protein
MAISKARITLTTLVGYLFLAASDSVAEMNVLTIREAQRILDLVPAVAESNAQGHCPLYNVLDESATWLSIQVREACPPPGFASNLLGNYVINRRTGAVAEGLDADSLGPRISTPEISSVTNDLLRRARGRVLNAKEAECLVLEAARSDMGVSGPAGTYSASELTEARGEFRFSVQHRLLKGSAVAVKFFTVRSDTAGVRDDSTGEQVISPGLALLTSRILSAEEFSGISVDEALTIALEVPSIAGLVGTGCSELVSNGDGTSNGIYIGIRSSCPGARNDTVSTVAAVNPQNGRVTDPKTQRSLDSAESQKTAQQILQRLHERLDRDRAAVAATCKP